VYGAMAVARPILVLGPAECHATELIDFEQYARHVEHGDVEAMERKMRELSDMPRVLRDLMGQRAALVLGEHYGEERLAGSLVRIMEAALKGEKPSLDALPEAPQETRRAA